MEAFAIASAVLLILWPLAFGIGVLQDVRLCEPVAKVLLALSFVWMTLGSPRWHGDTSATRGLGSPTGMLALLRTGRAIDRWTVILAAGCISGGLVGLSVLDWPVAARFFRLPRWCRTVPDQWYEWLTIVAGTLAISVFLITCVVRYENLRSALRWAARVGGLVLLYSALLAFIARGGEALGKIDWGLFASKAANHSFWGLIQQSVFTGFFSARLRKAFEPERLGAVHQPIWRRFVLGSAIALILGGAFAVSVAAARPAKGYLAQAPAFMALLWPPALAWAHAFARAPRRTAVATLGGSFFALMHHDSYELMLVTFILGTCFSYAAMEDRWRNVAVFSIVHGTLGAAILTLFGGKGFFRISLSVSPWAVKHPAWPHLVVPILASVAYGALAFVMMRRAPSR